MALSLRFSIQATHRDYLHWNSLTLRFELNCVEYLRCVLRFANVYLAHNAALRTQKFQDGAATLNLIATNTVTFAHTRASCSWC
jgi:hypothetical protein